MQNEKGFVAVIVVLALFVVAITSLAREPLYSPQLQNAKSSNSLGAVDSSGSLRGGAGFCGDDIIQSGEECDGDAINPAHTCNAAGYDLGSLSCSACRLVYTGCSHDLSACPWDLDGNGVVQPGDRGFVSANIGCVVGVNDPSCGNVDLDANGFVNAGDRGHVAANIGPCPSAGFHSECIGAICQQVEGSGEDECQNNFDCKVTPTCFDSDNGAVMFTSGTINGHNGESPFSLSDFCAGAEITEYSCDPLAVGSIRGEFSSCENYGASCSNGSCYFAENPSVFGTVRFVPSASNSAQERELCGRLVGDAEWKYWGLFLPLEIRLRPGDYQYSAFCTGSVSGSFSLTQGQTRWVIVS